ncbi:MAG: nucleoside-diphosphate kinase [Bacteroidetes bacterium]|jgi:nucleoside-diphosphate kinase|nr:nucleoside-diphosphate kinase [Bacteroidota bacterium]
MTGRITLTMIKPGAVANEHIGPILHKINEAGFHIAAMKFFSLTKIMAYSFYKVHEQKPWFNELMEFMISGPVVVAILEKDNAVADYRKLMGTTNPKEAEDGTIRKLFGNSVGSNAVHGSDSDENAKIECDFFFAMSERYYLLEETGV